MTDDREIIARRFRERTGIGLRISEDHADTALSALTAAGRVIVDAGEWERATKPRVLVTSDRSHLPVEGFDHAMMLLAEQNLAIDYGSSRLTEVERDLAVAQALLREAMVGLGWYAENGRLCRLIHSEGDPGRHALDADGGTRALALATKIAALLPQAPTKEPDHE